MRCRQCGQVHEIDARAIWGLSFTGLCYPCAIQSVAPGGDAHKKRLRRKHGRCQICGLTEPDILVVHHADSDHENNDESNLMVLCPNCHARIHRGRGLS